MTTEQITTIRQAVELLATGPVDPHTAPPEWGRVDERARMLYVIDPAPPGWSRMQLVLDADECLIEVILDTADGHELSLEDLADALGEVRFLEQPVGTALELFTFGLGTGRYRVTATVAPTSPTATTRVSIATV